MEQYNNDNARIGSIVGTYNYSNNEVSWEYIAIGDIESKLVKLLNFHNGKIVKLNREFLYVQGIPKNGVYLTFEQEAMSTGEFVHFKKSKLPFRITKIHARELTADLRSEDLDLDITNVSLAYLRYINKEDRDRALADV